ncbi:Fic family protein [Guyparkeria sp. SCN-R1]|uniref:Fic family protein n=1 Tax=Guyparkeria sp. SCN-R1 TaxID=2341113 RepID=UPI000F648E96|nr:Fic family protein [Guyparkeria sp. SCN-R1]RRQ24358.1 Fic family protein [Guyparkeria sp. SCN-R1]
MKKPLSPPDISQVLSRLSADEIIHAMQAQEGPLVEGRYLHWDELRHRGPPEGLDHETWWAMVRTARQAQLRSLPLVDTHGSPIRFSMPEPVLRHLSPIDKGAAGEILFPEQVANSSDRDRYIVNSLIEEAITSSQLEGACTTRVVAEEMLREGRDPEDRGELMIFNNYRAMEWVREHKNKPLTPELLLDLHRIVTEGTLETPEDAGRLRKRDDVRVVDHRDQIVLHQPPLASELPERVEWLCAFANGSEEDEPFVPPVLRAILLHFMIGYDHPFVDGNGRAARALFYWSMARQGYWLMEYLSISHIIKRAPSKYARAFLYCETDRNDTTYFILHQLRVIREAIDSLHHYLARKSKEQQDTEKRLRGSRAFRGQLNHRQLALLSHALKHPGYDYLIEGHQRSHDVSYATARSDLLKLADAGLLDKTKRGRAWVFIVPEDLSRRIEDVAE